MRIRSDFLEDGMISIPFRKTPLVTITVLSSVTLALFAGPAAAEPLATFRVAQDTANPVAPPNLTPEQKKKLEDLKRLREQGNKPLEKPPVTVKPPVAPKLVNPPPVVKPQPLLGAAADRSLQDLVEPCRKRLRAPLLG